MKIEKGVVSELTEQRAPPKSHATQRLVGSNRYEWPDHSAGLPSTPQHSTALHFHNIVHESSQQCSAWRPAHLLALIPLSRDLNEEGVAFIGGLRAPEMPYSHF